MMTEKISFRRGYISRSLFRIANALFLTITMVVTILPLVKIFVDSVDPTSYGMRLFPKQFELTAYKIIVTNPYLYKPFFVSVFTTLTGVFLGLFLTTIAGYVIMQKEMPGHTVIVNIVFVTMLFNGGLIPTYLTVRNFHLMNNYLAVIIPVGLNAYNIILIKSFFETIPLSLFDAAEIDGCTPLGIFTKIVLPLSKPALASIGLFIAVSVWNEYMKFVLYITNPDMTNFQVKLRELILSDGANNLDTSLAADMLKSAVVFVVIVPFLLVYPFLQKYFVKGVTVGAVKE